MKERWLPVVGYEGLYEASNKGQVRSLPREQEIYRGGQYVRQGRVLRQKQTTHWPPRLAVTLYAHGAQKMHQAHSLVLSAFVGAPPVGQETRHLDGNPANNVLTNLCYGSPVENRADQDRHGTAARGSRHGMAKATEGCVARMFDLRQFGCGLQAIANWIGLSRSQVGLILAGKYWAGVRA